MGFGKVLGRPTADGSRLFGLILGQNGPVHVFQGPSSLILLTFRSVGRWVARAITTLFGHQTRPTCCIASGAPDARATTRSTPGRPHLRFSRQISKLERGPP